LFSLVNGLDPLPPLSPGSTRNEGVGGLSPVIPPSTPLDSVRSCRLAIPAAFVSGPLGARSHDSPERSVSSGVPTASRSTIRPRRQSASSRDADDPRSQTAPFVAPTSAAVPAVAIPVGRDNPLVVKAQDPADRSITGTFNNLFDHRFLCINWTTAHHLDGHNGPLSSTFEGFTHRAEGFHTKWRGSREHD
jgi:hypothetical protein